MSERALKMRSPGFTLIELLIAVSIFVFLIMLAGPQYAQFLASSQVRNAAEAILNGVQMAQSAALNDNTEARLLLDPTTGAGGWQIYKTIEGTEPSPPNPIQVYSLIEGARDTALTVTPAGATQITFDGFGRVRSELAAEQCAGTNGFYKNADCSDAMRCIDVASTKISSARNLRVVISSDPSKIGTKLCDPAAASTEPQACPAKCSN